LHRCAASRPRRLKRVDKDKKHLHVTKGYYLSYYILGYLILSLHSTFCQATHSPPGSPQSHCR
jgi:hypothetical protein